MPGGFGSGGGACLFGMGGGGGIFLPGIEGADGMNEVGGYVGQSRLRHLYESDAWNGGKFTLVFCNSSLPVVECTRIQDGTRSKGTTAMTLVNATTLQMPDQLMDVEDGGVVRCMRALVAAILPLSLDAPPKSPSSASPSSD